MEPTTKTKLFQVTDYYIPIDTTKDAITVEPTDNHFYCYTIWEILGYRDLVKKDAPAWKK